MMEDIEWLDSSSEDEVVVDDDIQEDEGDARWNDYDSEKEKDDESNVSHGSYDSYQIHVEVKKGSSVGSEKEGVPMRLSELALNPHFKYARFDPAYFNSCLAKETASFFTSDTRIWKELAFCLCEGNLDIVLETALRLNRVESLVLIYQDDEADGDDEDESLVEVLPVRGMGTLLKFNTSLTSLRIRAATMDAADAESLSLGLQWNTTLKRINLCCLLEDDDVVSQLARGLKKNKSIESVALDGGPDFSDLIRALRGKPNLRELSIRTQDLAYEAHALTGLLRLETTKLDSLHLENICPYQTEIPKYLPEAIKKHESITSLKLVNLHLSCASLVVTHNHCFEEKQLQNLQELTLDACHVGEEGGSFVALVLSRNPTLKKLSIERIGTGFQGIRDLASSLKKHSSLQVLNVRDNGITDADFELLAPSLLKHPTLEDLDLSRNEIAQTAAVANIISNNSVLQKMTLLDNAIEIQNVKSIAVALRSNSTLKVIALTGARTADVLESEMQSELEIMGLELEILKDNSQLEYLELADGRSLDCLPEMKREMMQLCNFNRGGKHILQDQSFSLALWPLVLERADKSVYYQAYDDATVKATNETPQASVMFSLLREASTQLFSQYHRTTEPAPRQGRAKRRRSD
jgi:hypothetical protein